ncbi:RluA family pseudouridine synthase [Lactococcus hircilactis]|uniref:RNA pseudouridylate synthase n=1 Tax=Lactococcus hircilactis TaxID=1494462 RepID=A0A7X2D120_9LACT|nr:RluA family pseudouridine synthase [Lactococcus hircilactis]
MQFSFTNEINQSMVKNLLKRHGVSKRLLSNIKFDGGKILVNAHEENAIFRLRVGDVVTILVPDEPDNECLVPEDLALEVLFEDEHYLVVNKPAGVPSITGVNHPKGAMSNAVKGYIARQGYKNQAVHIITRLDRSTSGVMFFAKHRYAHALMNMNSNYRKSLQKRYFAIVDANSKLSVLTEMEKAAVSEQLRDCGQKLPQTGSIQLPIGRLDGSIIQRQVRFDAGSKQAHTSYEIVKEKNGLQLLDIQLHTGRTHQIRVHFSHLGFPLIGDDLYGGNHELLTRQALHCHHLQFLHPFTDQCIDIELPLPSDMKKILS